MADIRINALATTAASTASDDFVAVDGSANGTRKLNAFSPTFGGNLTVSGAGTNGFKAVSLSDGATYGGLTLNGAIASGTMSGIYGGGDSNLYATAPTSVWILTAGTEQARFTSTATTLAGNLTVSGAGNSSVAGNLGIGETSPVVPLHVKTTGTGTGDFDNAIATLRSTAAGRTITLQFSDTTNQSYISSKSGALNFGVGGAVLGMSLSSGGNLTVSGTVSSGAITSSFYDALSSFTRTGLNGAGAAGVLAIATDGKTAGDAMMVSIQGKDSANNTQTYGQIKATIVDPTSTSEDSTFAIQTVTAGSLADAAVFSQSAATLTGNLTVSGTTGVTATDVILGSSGPSVKSTLSARAPRQGLVFDGSAGATVSGVPAFGTAGYTYAVTLNASSLPGAYIFDGDETPALIVTTTGEVEIYDRVAEADVYKSAVGTIVAGKTYHVVYSRAIGLFINGVNVSGAVADASNYTGTTIRVGSRFSDVIIFPGLLIPLIYNRALSASEVVALYEAGAPAGADYNSASNTAVYSTDFSTSTGWSFGGGGSGISGGKLNLVDNDYAAAPSSTALKTGKRYRFTVTVDSITAGNVSYYNGSAYVSFATSAGTYTVDFTAPAAYSFLILKSFGGNAVCDTFAFYNTGLLLAPDAAQAGGGLVWYDTSGNAANISWTSGVSWNVPTSAKVATGWSFGGNLLVGTTTDAGYTIVGRGTDASVAAMSADSTSQLRLNAQSGIAILETVTNTPLRIRTNSTEAMRLFANGNVFIGASPVDGGQKLQVSGSAALAGDLLISTNSVINFTVHDAYLRSAGGKSIFLQPAGTTALTLDSSQNATFAGATVNVSKAGNNPAFKATDGSIITKLQSLTAGDTAGWVGTESNHTFRIVTNNTTAASFDTSQNATFAGTKMTMNSGASQSGQRQNLTSSITAGASTVSKKIAYVGPSHAVKVSILAVQDNSVAHVATFSGDFTTSYGGNSTGGTTSAVVGNITAITVAYDNSGSPAYTINVTLTYTGNAPVIYYTIDGHSFNAIAAQ